MEWIKTQYKSYHIIIYSHITQYFFGINIHLASIPVFTRVWNVGELTAILLKCVIYCGSNVRLGGVHQGASSDGSGWASDHQIQPPLLNHGSSRLLDILDECRLHQSEHFGWTILPYLGETHTTTTTTSDWSIQLGDGGNATLSKKVLGVSLISGQEKARARPEWPTKSGRAWILLGTRVDRVVSWLSGSKMDWGQWY